MPVREKWIYMGAGLIFSVLLIGITLINLNGVMHLSTSQMIMVDRAELLINARDKALQMQVDFKVQVQEWKNILIRGTDPADFERYFRQFEQREAAVQGCLAYLQGHGNAVEPMRQEIQNLASTHLRLGEEYRSALRFFDPRNPTSYQVVDRIVRGIDRRPQADMERLVNEIKIFTNREVAVGLESLDQVRRSTFFLSVASVVVGLILTAGFLTWLFRNYQRLHNARLAALAASQAKSAFLANVSHEIRTPLNGVLGMMQVLRETPLTREQIDYVDIMESSGQVLVALLNDLLDYSKIEARKVDLQATPFELGAVLHGISSLLRHRAREKGIGLHVSTAPDTPARLECDEIRLRQVLLNLAHNAVKFTEKGKVEIRARWEPGPEDGGKAGRLHFEVEDTGLGIPEEVLSRLFQPFQQADATTTRRFGGTGLGLAICKNLVELMGGEISVRSVEGQGSVFSFFVQARIDPTRPAPAPSEAPTGVAETPAAGPLAARESRELQLLLVEDNAVNRKVALLFLKRMGLTADWVENGLEAIEALQRKPYDIILMDMQMPVMDGPEAVRRIREDRGNPTQPWIVALTAGALQQNREQAMAAGFNDYITKPVGYELLREKITRKAHELGRDFSPDSVAAVATP